ncbi:hypothetical protein E4U21_000611 [Claviceps maximensis]|nr:hypothetical protein E4U21_000611 [Claviceps maximensis]
MPGAFHTDGVRQGRFCPPASPSSSPAYLPPPRSSVETSSFKRKRPRDDIRHFDFANDRGDGGLFDHGELNNASTLLITPAGRRVAQNGRPYTLAGQLDTPRGGAADGELGGDSIFSDTDYRKALGSKTSRDHLDAAQTSGPTSLFHLPPQPKRPSPGWSTLAISTLGDVVGKMWEFCTAGAFKGFHAGGDGDFEPELPEQDVSSPSRAKPDLPRHSKDNCDGTGEQDHRRIPGHFPRGNCYHDQNAVPVAVAESSVPSGTSSPPRHSAKRRQTAPMDDLGRNWVMVKDREGVEDDTSGTSTTLRSSYSNSSLRNRNQGPSAVTGRRISSPGHRRESVRLPGAASSRAPPRPSIINAFTTTTTTTTSTSSPSTFEHAPPAPSASSASFASPRCASPTKLAGAAPNIAASVASPTPATPRGHRRRRSTNGSQQIFTHGRTQSTASTASSRGATDDVENSPHLTQEAKQLAARIYREERDTDVKIAALNKQLKDMIRQGKEALGTTIEVDGEDGEPGADVEDGGWEDY